MAAAKTVIRKTTEENVESTGLFMTELKTEQESLVFVKRMVAVAVSSITYLRGIFPESAYRSRYLEDLCVKVLREDSHASAASKVVKWMMGCFDAIERQFLHIVFIGYITESYHFKFKYTNMGPQMDILRNNNVAVHVTMEDTKRATVLLIRKLFLLIQNLDALPSNVHLTMNLYYYDDITPADYQPPGFKAGECDSVWFEGVKTNFEVGEVQTGFHTIRMHVSAEQGRLKKLLKKKHLEQHMQVPHTLYLQTEGIEEPRKKLKEGNLPSEDESAQFKKPVKRVTKKNTAAKKAVRKKRRI
ncbi:zebrafish testis-expressed 38 isoform X2 [Nelusetta ayraudi]|uniref:zebrafish testis-expressed 38 isoform X2 n=1 Tax=Nelusetta ayraudi TaxID=303726 RepID=UPI003F6FDA52